MAIDQQRLQMGILKWIKEASDKTIGQIVTGAQRKKLTPPDLPHEGEVLEGMWTLIRQGLIFPVMQGSSPVHWRLVLTRAGEAAVEEGQFNPYDTESYLIELKEKIPQASKQVFQYVYEGLLSFRNECYLANAVMLGAASETAFLEMAFSCAKWLSTTDGTKLKKVLEGRTGFAVKFEEFRDTLNNHKQKLGKLKDGLTLTLDAVLDLLRVHRNDAGHPTDKAFTHADARTLLNLLPGYLRRMYDLKLLFDS